MEGNTVLQRGDVHLAIETNDTDRAFKHRAGNDVDDDRGLRTVAGCRFGNLHRDTAGSIESMDERPIGVNRVALAFQSED